MNLNLTDTIALVVGASSGIGAATAALLAEEGADVAIGYARNEAGAQATAQAVAAHGRRAWPLCMEVQNPESVAEAMAHLRTEVPHLDVVVFCAGQNIITPWEQITPDEWTQIVAVNLNGAFYVLQAAAPLLRDGGAIVTVASVAAHTGAPHHAHYAAAKAGLINLTKSLARSLAPRIRVNCVAPGITDTLMGRDTINALAPDYAATRIPLQRFATPEEIARWIVFVASPASGFMTGATIDINGGRDMR